MKVKKEMVEEFFTKGGTYLDLVVHGICYQSAKNARDNGECAPVAAYRLAEVLNVPFWDFVEKTRGSFMAWRRVCLGLTQKQLAEKADVSVNALAIAERDHRMPTFNSLQKLASALNMTVSDYIGEGL